MIRWTEHAARMKGQTNYSENLQEIFFQNGHIQDRAQARIT